GDWLLSPTCCVSLFPRGPGARPPPVAPLPCWGESNARASPMTSAAFLHLLPLRRPPPPAGGIFSRLPAGLEVFCRCRCPTNALGSIRRVRRPRRGIDVEVLGMPSRNFVWDPNHWRF